VEQDRKILAEIQDENNEITYSQLRQIWKDATGNYDKKLANGTIHKILTEENISTKNLYHEPRERNTPENIEERKTYCLWAAKAAQDAIVFLDVHFFVLLINVCIIHSIKQTAFACPFETYEQEESENKLVYVYMIASI
jgi:hypothetical protein